MTAGRQLYGLFSPKKSQLRHDLINTYQDLLTLLNTLIREEHQAMLTQYRNDPITKTQLIQTFHTAKPEHDLPREIAYLRFFNLRFNSDPRFKNIVQRYNDFLETYQKAYTTLSALKAQASQHPAYSIQALTELATRHFNNSKLHLHIRKQLQALPTTLTVTNFAAIPAHHAPLQTAFTQSVRIKNAQRALPWYPFQHYYAAKLKILLLHCQREQQSVDIEQLINTSMATITEELREHIIEEHTEKQHALSKRTAELNETRMHREESHLKNERDKKLKAIESNQEKLHHLANEVADTMQDFNSPNAYKIFNRAIDEVNRSKRQWTPNRPTLFQYAEHSIIHQTAISKENDTPSTMQEYRVLFEEQIQEHKRATDALTFS